MKFSFVFQLPSLIGKGEISQFSCKETNNIIKTEYSIAVFYRQVEKHIRLLLGILIIMSLCHIAQATLLLMCIDQSFQIICS